MDVSNDSDDSAFLFSNNVPKRKSGCDVGNKQKKLRLNSQDGITSIDETHTGEQTGATSCLKNSIHADSPDVNNKILESENEKTDGENVVVGEKFESEKAKDYFSCPLCLKVLQSETTHFSHMKQCAKKSKMSAKQLLEALQLHKQHLKERISAGLSNFPTKKKKIHVHKGNGDSAYQLAIGLALSRSLQDTVVGKENEDLMDNTNMNKTNRKTLENFGFTSFGKPYTTTVKKTKNNKWIHSVLKERTNEDREKLLTEKAGVLLLINDDTIIAEGNESLRLYHCKHVEEIRSKESHLWKLGENNEETEWYVEDLKSIILEEDQKVVEEKQNQNVVKEECNIDKEILKLNLPKTTIFEGWRRLINNKYLSDLTLQTKDNETIYLHSVVLYARYLKILDSDLSTIFHEFHSCTVLTFLQYLYCGTLDGLVRGEVENLLKLAQSLEYEELLEVLNSLKKSLTLKKRNENSRDCSNSEENHWKKSMSSTPEMNNLSEWECTNSSSLEERHSRSVLSSEKDEIIYKNDECIEELHHEKKEESVIKEEVMNKVELHEESPTKPENNECLGVPEGIQNEETHENISPGKCKKWNTEEDQSEMDMFEEAENLNKSMNENVETCANVIHENEPECIEISSGSIKSDGTHTECRENVGENYKILSEMDYEIPYFDPYEHFNSEIPDVEPFADPEEPVHSQSLIVGEISPVKSVPEIPKHLNTSFSYNSPPSITPGCCSTPINELPQPSTSAQPDFISSEQTERPTKKKRYATPCSKINRKSGRLSKLFRSKSQKKYRERKSKIDSDEEESEKVACALTESILREFDKTIGSAARETPPREQNYIEVTPAVLGEEYVEDVSPLPDYSVMGASSLKKHLTKYGLKKSLSKNKAKKILRHIYEELHPILNTKNGKIVKYVQSDKPKKGRGKKETTRGRKSKRKSTVKRSSTPTGKGRSGVDLQLNQLETPTKKRNSCSSSSPRLTSPKTSVEEDIQSSTNTDSWDGASACSTVSDRNCFEMEEPLSQNNYTSATDAPTAVYDFIQNNPDIRRQILMYEPIWLEELQRKLFEKYNKKFKLTDLMDCLDAECVTFRCESQRRTNSRRK